MIKLMPKVMCYHAHSSPMIKGNDQHKMLTESLHTDKETGERGKQKRDLRDSEAVCVVEIIKCQLTIINTIVVGNGLVRAFFKE